MSTQSKTAEQLIAKVKSSSLKEEEKAVLIMALESMVDIPEGHYVMGSAGRVGLWALLGIGGEVGHQPDEGEYQTDVKPFCISKYAVTQALYQAVTGENPSRYNNAQYPVTNVSWGQAVAFCEKFNEMADGLLPDGMRLGLPTEEQWEYACRAGTTTALNNGKNLTAKKGSLPELDEVAWYEKNSEEHPHQVGQKKPNDWGLYDMHGNVWEWCSSMYYFDLGDIPEEESEKDKALRRKCARGGSWHSRPSRCRSAQRGNFYADTRSDRIGFRLAIISNG